MEVSEAVKLQTLPDRKVKNQDLVCDSKIKFEKRDFGQSKIIQNPPRFMFKTGGISLNRKFNAHR